jgi:hypothetical protein
MITRWLQRWAEETAPWDGYIDLLAGLPDNF